MAKERPMDPALRTSTKRASQSKWSNDVRNVVVDTSPDDPHHVAVPKAEHMPKVRQHIRGIDGVVLQGGHPIHDDDLIVAFGEGQMALADRRAPLGWAERHWPDSKMHVIVGGRRASARGPIELLDGRGH